MGRKLSTYLLLCNVFSADAWLLRRWADVLSNEVVMKFAYVFCCLHFDYAHKLLFLLVHFVAQY